MMLHQIGRWVVRLLLLHKLVDFLAKTWPTNLLFLNFKKFSAWWKTIPRFKRHVATNIIVGLMIVVFLHLFHGLSWLREAEDAGIDWMIRMNKGIVENPKASYAFLDIDEKTYRYWGEPFYTPRDGLLKIINYATSGQPKLVFVDVELANKGHDPHADYDLEQFLAHYPAQAPPLILVRTFRTQLDKPDKIEQRVSFLDEIVSNNANVFWASTLFLREADHSVRRWQLWTSAENSQSEPELIPSIQLLATMISQQSSLSPLKVHKELIDKLTPYVMGKKFPKDTLKLPGLTITLQPQPLQQRIIYKFPAQYNEGISPPTIKTSHGSESLVIQRSVLPLITESHPVDNSWLKDRIVVIGASYADSKDIHSTPLGEMPGAMLLVNAIHSLLQHGEIKPPTPWVKIFVEITLITVMSFAFAWLSTFWGMVLSGVFIVVVLLPFSFIFFKHGVWLDFAIPLLGVQLHEMAAEFEEKIKHKKKKADAM